MISCEESDLANDLIDELLSTSWQACSILPLQNFDFNAVRLKKYSNKIQEIIKSRVGVSDKTEWKVSVSVVSGSNKSENDHPTVIVTVKGKNEQKEIPYYTGYLMSCKNNTAYVEGINLPLLLYNGRDIFPSVVHNLMENLFDTKIRKLNLTQHDFRYLCSLVIPVLNGLNLNDVVVYKYRIPCRPKSEYLLFEIRLKKLLELWNSVCTQCVNTTSNADLFNIELHARFHAGLSEHFNLTFGINSRQAHLAQVFVPRMFSMNSNGKIMFTSPKLMGIVLRHLSKLCDIAEEMTRTSDFQFLSKSYNTVFYNSRVV